MGQDGVIFRRNRMPQWRMDSAVYFITWCLNNRSDTLTPEERTFITECIRHHHGTRYFLALYVVMDDHVHLVLQTVPGEDLSKVLKTLKGYTARMLNRMRGVRGVFWQKASHTEILAHPAAIRSRVEYVYNNPARRWGIESHTYPWLEVFEL